MSVESLFDYFGSMKILIAFYLLLGAYTAGFIREFQGHTISEELILTGFTLACFILAAIPIWVRRRREGVLKRDGFFWLGLTFGMYVLGLGLGWYYSSNSYLGGSN